jgi:predicted phage tail protein
MLREIKLYGRLAKFIGKRVFHADVATAAEAVRFLLANFPHLEPELVKGHYRVSVGSYDLAEDELLHPAGAQCIKIVPVVSGAGATGRIIAGVLLIAVASVFSLGAVAGIALNAVVFGIGASLVLGGVAQLLTPVPKVPTGNDKEQDPRKSYSFSGIQNTSRQGVAVPVVYGETIVGSVTISAGVDTDQVTA